MTAPPSLPLRRLLVAVGFLAAVTAAGCGSSAAPVTSSNSSGSTQTATPGTAGQAATGGVADTVHTGVFHHLRCGPSHGAHLYLGHRVIRRRGQPLQPAPSGLQYSNPSAELI